LSPAPISAFEKCAPPSRTKFLQSAPTNGASDVYMSFDSWEAAAETRPLGGGIGVAGRKAAATRHLSASPPTGLPHGAPNAAKGMGAPRGFDGSPGLYAARAAPWQALPAKFAIKVICYALREPVEGAFIATAPVRLSATATHGFTPAGSCRNPDRPGSLGSKAATLCARGSSARFSLATSEPRSVGLVALTDEGRCSPTRVKSSSKPWGPAPGAFFLGPGCSGGAPGFT
jgi:hypothetical protein